MKPSRSDFVFLGLAFASGSACWWRGGSPLVIAGLMDAAELLLLVLPQLAAGLLMGGLVARLVGREKVAALLGNRSGVRGLLLASFMGAVTPGGPFTSFPVVHALWMAGADAGALIAYLSAWSLIGLNRLIIWELPLMGGEFTALRMIACLPLPVLGGIIARVLVRSSRLKLKTEPAE